MRNTHNMQIEKMRHRRPRNADCFLEDHRVTRYPNIFEDLEEEDFMF